MTAEQPIREWIAEAIVQERGLNFWNGIPKEIYRQADTILAELNRRLDGIDFTQYHSKVSGLEWVDGFNEAIQAMKEMLK